jgi:Response regulator containing a CheY-like receiver domain and an HD-GYP domain
MNVLVIEDNSIHLKLARLVLSSAGYQVRTAEAAEHAFNSIKEDKPQVILMDMELPDMDGLTLVRKLKADKETRDIRIVAVTGYPDRYKKTDALAAGCDAYLLKPISTRTLPEVVREVAQNSPNEKS